MILNNDATTTLAGTVSGTLLVVILQINNSEILKTAVLAAIGAVISFIVSKAMKYLWKRVQKKKSC